MASSSVMWPSNPASMKPGRRVDQQAEPAEARLALDAGDEVVGHAHPLERRAEHELAGVEHEHAVGGDLDQLGELLEVLLDVDHAGRVVAEDAEQVADLDVDRRRLDAARRRRGRSGCDRRRWPRAGCGRRGSRLVTVAIGGRRSTEVHGRTGYVSDAHVHGLGRTRRPALLSAGRAQDAAAARAAWSSAE